MKSSRDQNKDAYRSREGGDDLACLADPGSEIRLGKEKGKEKREDSARDACAKTTNNQNKIWLQVALVEVL